MQIFALFTILMPVVVTAQIEIATECNENLCLTLYEQTLNWYGARDACKRLNQSLVAITDQSVQNVVERLAKHAQNNAYLWTAGYVTNSTEWKSFDNRKFTVSVTSTTSYVFAYMTLSTGGLTGISYNTGRYVVCQRGPIGAECASEEFMVGDYCYRMGSNKTETWYEAVNLCHNTSTGSTLATGIANLKNVRPFLPSTVQYVWTDVHRREFVWRKDSSDVPIRFFKPVTYPSSVHRCIHFRVSDNKWNFPFCTNGFHLGFICEKDIPRQTTQPSHPDTSYTETMEMTVPPTEGLPDAKGQGIPTAAWISLICVVVVLFVIVIGLVAFVVWIRNKVVALDKKVMKHANYKPTDKRVANPSTQTNKAYNKTQEDSLEYYEELRD